MAQCNAQVMKCGSIYSGMSTPKIAVVWLAFNMHDFMQTPLHDQKFGVWCKIS
jgi:hypothetical protein